MGICKSDSCFTCKIPADKCRGGTGKTAYIERANASVFKKPKDSAPTYPISTSAYRRSKHGFGMEG